jgi:hypothetical protein
MNITGRFRGNFIAIADKTISPKSNYTFQYKIIKLTNIVIINAREIDDNTFNEIFERSITITNLDNQIAKIEKSINAPFQDSNRLLIGINPLRISNLKLENTQKVAKGYFFERLKGIKILDTLLAISWNIFIFIPSLFYHKFKPVNDEIYFGKIEGDFVGKEPKTNTSVNPVLPSNLESIVATPSINPADLVEPLLPAPTS